jgi:hypothetical protein
MTPTTRLGTVLLASASLVTIPAAASAQNTVMNDLASEDMNTTTTATDPTLNAPADDGFGDLNETTITNTEPVEEEDDDDFPWGLLGLLGLAGLMGLKKRDDRDVHVDARRDTRP